MQLPAPNFLNQRRRWLITQIIQSRTYLSSVGISELQAAVVGVCKGCTGGGVPASWRVVGPCVFTSDGKTDSRSSSSSSSRRIMAQIRDSSIALPGNTHITYRRPHQPDVIGLRVCTVTRCRTDWCRVTDVHRNTKGRFFNAQLIDD